MFQGDTSLFAARRGRSIRRWHDDVTVTDAYVVQTDQATYYDIPEGKQLVVVKLFYGCETIDEEMECYSVSCDAKAGGGNATQLAHHNHDFVGDKKTGRAHQEKLCDPPLIVKYSDGARSFSLAVKATDSSTVVCFGWNGWVEDERTLS